MISIGNIEISQVRHGGVLANGVYLGSNKLWPEDAPVPVQTDAVTFVANEAGAKVMLQKNGNPPSVSLVYSLDGSTWSDYTMGQTFTLSNVGDMFCIRAKTTNSEFSTTSDYYYFWTSGNLSLMGNINTLMAADGEVEKAGCFIYLFNRTTITDAGGFELPSTAITEKCYMQLFRGCSSMVVGPKSLPALDISAAGGTSKQHYYQMFLECSSLLESPVIDMEYGNATLVLGSMFEGCTSLRKITLSKATSWNNINTTDWVKKVSSTGEFVCKESLPDQRGNSKIPAGWTKVDIDTI